MLHPFMKYYFLSRIKDISDFGKLPMQAYFHRQAPPNTLRGSHPRDFWEVMDHNSTEKLWIHVYGYGWVHYRGACRFKSPKKVVVQGQWKCTFWLLHNRILDVTAKHVRSRAHRATQSMCFCHQADCMPWEPVILGVRFYFEHTVFGPQAPATVGKMKQASALLKQQRSCVSHMCVKKNHPNNQESRVYNGDPPFPAHLFKVFTHLTQGQTSFLHYYDPTWKTVSFKH